MFNATLARSEETEFKEETICNYIRTMTKILISEIPEEP